MSKLSATASARVTDCLEQRRCLACLKPARRGRMIRGCHERCYRATLRGASLGKCTLDERVAEGKLLPANSRNRRARNPVTRELMKRGAK